MVSRFEPYVAGAGVSQDDVPHEAARLRSWGDLHRWLDARRPHSVLRRMRRVPIITAKLDMSLRRSLREKFGLIELVPLEAFTPRGWEAVVAHRQRLSLALSVVSTVGLLVLTFFVLQNQQLPEMTRALYMVVYGAMTFFLASNFWKTMLGTLYMLRGAAGNPWHPSRAMSDPDPETRVAVLYPVYHEEVARVAAGIAATWESLARGHPALAQHFDNFLISDSQLPGYAVIEEAAVHELARAFPDGRFYYRRRQGNANAKLGNIEDFCRRWGDDYKYMLVMDADSIMDGDALVTLLRMMEGNDRLGILQSNPKPVLRENLFGRMHQFAARLYGTVFSYSLQVMNMGNATYIGHNAMIRLEPFINHCILPVLSGPRPWGGKPLSHDTVESAMMARAGYEVWFLPEIAGSFEEVPANILGFLARERRWMQGNLQHLRFVFLPGLRSIHRETFLNGSLGYIAAPLWAFFLVLSTYGMLHFLRFGMSGFGNLSSLRMPLAYLLVSALVFLFLPRIIAFAIHIGSDRAWQYGGKFKLTISVLLETVFSLVFSPIIMIFVTRFIWLWLRRKAISWDTQQRGDEPLPWSACLRAFGWVSPVGLVALASLTWSINLIPVNLSLIVEYMSGGWLRGEYLIYWLSPILFAFVGAAWIVRVTSLSFPALRKARLFCIPEEIAPPGVVAAVPVWQRQFEALLPNADDREAALKFAVSSRQFYIRHRAETRSRPRIAGYLLPKIENDEALSDRELLFGLSERSCFDLLHRKSVEQCTVSA